jgi:hypothetical protein
VVGQGTCFQCPVCQEEQSYKHKEIALHWHVWYIRLCLDCKLDEYIKCSKCENHFQVDILDWDHSKAKKALDNSILRAMIRIMMANGSVIKVDDNVDTKPIDIMHDIYESITNTQITTNEILNEVGECAESGNIMTDLVYFGPFLSGEQKDLILKAMILTALEDGDLKEEEAITLVQAGQALGVTNSHTKEMLHDEYQNQVEREAVLEKAPPHECLDVPKIVKEDVEQGFGPQQVESELEMKQRGSDKQRCHCKNKHRDIETPTVEMRMRLEKEGMTTVPCVNPWDYLTEDAMQPRRPVETVQTRKLLAGYA